MTGIRLSSFELEAICSTFKLFFGLDDHLWLFGSRVRSEEKGGDIDLYIETQTCDATKVNDLRFAFLTELYFKIGDQKNDVVLNRVLVSKELPIYAIAKKEGVQIV